jgi:hypothetical protein
MLWFPFNTFSSKITTADGILYNGLGTALALRTQRRCPWGSLYYREKAYLTLSQGL